MIRSIKIASLFVLAMLIYTASFAQAKPAAPAAAPASNENPNWAKTDGMYAVFTTAKGKIVCELEFKKAPLTVGNFVALAEGNHPKADVRNKQPFFDGLIFHRVEPGFVIQGGDPMGSGMGGPGYKFNNEIEPTLKHNRAGTLAMANAGPNTNGCQFYITLSATSMLDGGYSVFGYVVEGQSVVNSITKGDTMRTVKIVRVGKEAKAFNAPAAFTKTQEEAEKKAAEAKAKAEAAAKEKEASWDARVKAKYPTAKKTASGLYYTVDQEGTGAVANPGQTVVAHYTGTLFDDGKKFDSSVDRGQPFEFPLGQHRVIAGWDEGFGLFKVGSKGKLIIPSKLAYGPNGAGGGVIPPNADLVFEVEMLGVK
jgi:FKBP-type peptidyl-prolyl cis-trans isomerase